MSSEISPLLKNLPAPALVTFKGDGFIADPLSKQASGKMTLAKRFWGVTITIDKDLGVEATETAGKIKNVVARFFLYIFALASLLLNSWNIRNLKGIQNYYGYAKNFSATENVSINVNNFFNMCIQCMQLMYDPTKKGSEKDVVEQLDKTKKGLILHLIEQLYDPKNPRHSFLLRERGFSFYDNGEKSKAKDDIEAYKKIMHHSETMKKQYNDQDETVKQLIEQILNDSVQN